MKKLLYAALTAITISLLAGCTTTTAELTSTTDNMETWTVDAPLEATFKAFKRHANECCAFNGLLGDHHAVVPIYYGDDAEIMVQHRGNPLDHTTVLYFDLQKGADGTGVRAWYYNSRWKDLLDTFKHIEVSKDQ